MNDYPYIEELKDIYSEVHKDLFGCRYRGYWREDTTEEDVQNAIRELGRQLEEQMEHEDHWYKMMQEKDAYENRMMALDPPHRYERMAERLGLPV
jgi:hypothetical protein